MKLTSYTDYSIRVLIFLGVNDQRLCTALEISEFYDISRNHISKIVHQLSKLGLIESFKGASGGIQLKKRPEEINIGYLVRNTEPDFNVVECFNPEKTNCRIISICKMKSILNESTQMFLENLDRYTLQDVLKNKTSFKNI